MNSPLTCVKFNIDKNYDYGRPTWTAQADKGRNVLHMHQTLKLIYGASLKCI